MPEQSTIASEVVGCEFDDIAKVIVMGGAALELAGIREAGDIDIVTPLGNRDSLLRNNPARWHKQTHQRQRLDSGATFQLTSVADTNGRFDIWRHWYDWQREQGDRQLYFQDLVRHAWQHEAGFFVLNLDEIRRLKAASPRDKDARDVHLIDQYLASR